MNKPHRSRLLTELVFAVDDKIQWVCLASAVILLGLFVNFVYGVKFTFDSSTQVLSKSPNLYYMFGIVLCILFIRLTYKYLKFTASWMEIRHTLEGNDKEIISSLNAVQKLIKRYLSDIERYFFLFIFLLLIINRDLPLRVQLSEIIVYPNLIPCALMLFVAFFLAIEWPTICLSIRYYKVIRTKVAKTESMSF